MTVNDSFYGRVANRMEELYPNASREYMPHENLHRPLFCPDVIELKSDLAVQAEAIVEAFWKVRNLEDRKTQLEMTPPLTPDPGNSSVLMSYDFHVDEQQNLRLIEVNTNASLSLAADLLHDVHGVPNRFADNFRDEIVKSFLHEAKLALPHLDRKPKIAIVDANPTKQKLFLEFLLYRDLFETSGLNTSIIDTCDLKFTGDSLSAHGEKVDLIYNRDTDFYLEKPEHQALKASTLEGRACVTPHPHEYRLLADKERLLELSRPGVIESLAIPEADKKAIEKALIRTMDLSDLGTPEEVWAKRKGYFFKPKRSFGGKAAYRGSTMTRKILPELFKEEYVAQEFVPAPTLKLSEEEPFKYDLRFYVYENRIQIACARAYRGQMTNMQALGGGIAVIRWT